MYDLVFILDDGMAISFFWRKMLCNVDQVLDWLKQLYHLFLDSHFQADLIVILYISMGSDGQTMT